MRESVAFFLQLSADLLEVLDDAVVHHANPIARHVRMRIAFDGRAMSRPARVSDTHVAGQGFAIEAIRQLFDFADPPAPFDSSRAMWNDGESRGIVTAVFEAPQSFDENSRNVSARDGAHDAAHA